MCLRWRGPHRVEEALQVYVYPMEDQRNVELHTVHTHSTRLTLYCEDSLDSAAILSHLLSSEVGVQVSQLMKTVEN